MGRLAVGLGAHTHTHTYKLTLSHTCSHLASLLRVLHMGRLAVGLSRGQRLCQASKVTVVTFEELPMQVDGEPWMQVRPKGAPDGSRGEAVGSS
jgi:hypothetical protein